MESRNPVFARRGAAGQQGSWSPSPQQLRDMYDAPAYAPPTTRPVTLDDVVIRGSLSLGTLVVTGGLAWVLDAPTGVAFVAMIIGLVLWGVMTFGGRVNAPLVLGFAAAYGVAVGVVSHAYNYVYEGVVVQAVIGTALAFGAMLAVYALRVVRVTPAFARFAIGAGFALFGLMIVNLLVSLFSPSGIGIRTDSPIGWLFSIAAILVGCFFLLLDFASIEEAVRARAPEKFAWYAAFGLTLSLVWIYLELLRFLSYFTGRD